MKTLCIYCTRSGITENIAKVIADITNGELVKITDGKNRKGVFGYIGAAIQALGKKLPQLMPFNTKLPIEEYDRIIIACPIWCEDVCTLAKSFADQNNDKFKGEVILVASHMSGLTYEDKIKEFYKANNIKTHKYLTLQTKNYDWKKDVEKFFGE